MAYTSNLLEILTSNTSSGVYVASASTENSSTTYPAYKAFDQSNSTYWQTTTAGKYPSWLKIEFTSIDISPILTKYTITANSATDSPNSWTFEGSNNNSTWTTLDTQSSQTFTLNEKKVFTFSNSTKYRYYRVNISNNNGATTTSIAELEVMATLGLDFNVSGVTEQVEIQSSNFDISSITEQVEFQSSNFDISGLTAQVEYGQVDFDVSSITLQVEVYQDLDLYITCHTLKVEVLKFLGLATAGTGTTTTNLIIPSHGLNLNDFIVNTSVRSYQDLNTSELCSRKISVTDEDTIVLDYELVGQAEGDLIRMYRFEDITSQVLSETLVLNLRSNNSNTANFKLKCPISLGFLMNDLKCGQYIRISLDDEIRFLGMISDTKTTGFNDAVDICFQNVECISLKGIANRRTIIVDYAADKLTSEIVSELNNIYLRGEGLNENNYIETGLALGKPWRNDCISLADVFDDMANRNGYQWYIDDDWYLHFEKDPTTIPDALYNLTETGKLHFRDLQINHSLDNYVNKNFVIGGKDADGNVIKTWNYNLTQQQAMQDICGNTGVFGNILRDSNLSTVVYQSGGAGTAFFNIELTAHGLEVGDYIFNITLDMPFWITAVVDANNVTVNETIYDQTAGDSYILYPTCNKASKGILNKQSILPRFVEYTIDHIMLNPREKQVIELPRYGILEGDYNIETVVIKCRGSGIFESRISCVLRDSDNFTTQSFPTYQDYFRTF